MCVYAHTAARTLRKTDAREENGKRKTRYENRWFPCTRDTRAPELPIPHKLWRKFWLVRFLVNSSPRPTFYEEIIQLSFSALFFPFSSRGIACLNVLIYMYINKLYTFSDLFVLHVLFLEEEGLIFITWRNGAARRIPANTNLIGYIAITREFIFIKVMRMPQVLARTSFRTESSSSCFRNVGKKTDSGDVFNSYLTLLTDGHVIICTNFVHALHAFPSSTLDKEKSNRRLTKWTVCKSSEIQRWNNVDRIPPYAEYVQPVMRFCVNFATNYVEDGRGCARGLEGARFSSQHFVNKCRSLVCCVLLLWANSLSSIGL